MNDYDELGKTPEMEDKHGAIIKDIQLETKERELKKCCGDYPTVGWKEGRKVRLYCKTCGKSTPYYSPASVNASKAWNKLEEQ